MTAPKKYKKHTVVITLFDRGAYLTEQQVCRKVEKIVKEQFAIDYEGKYFYRIQVVQLRKLVTAKYRKILRSINNYEIYRCLGGH